MKLLVALEANDTILVQISEGEKALGHVNLNRGQALDISEQLRKLANVLPATADNHK
jgi:hypothetical protein